MNAFSNAAFFGTLREIEKEKSEREAEQARLGLEQGRLQLQERGVNLQEKQLAQSEEQSRIANRLKAEELQINRDRYASQTRGEQMTQVRDLAKSYGALLDLHSTRTGSPIFDVVLEGENGESYNLFDEGIRNLMSANPNLSRSAAQGLLIEARTEARNQMRIANQPQSPVSGAYVPVDGQGGPIPIDVFNRLPPEQQDRYVFTDVSSVSPSLSGVVEPTRTTTSRIESDLLGAQESLDALNNISQVMAKAEADGENIFGVEGFVQGLVNVTYAQLEPSVFSENRAEFEQAKNTAVERMLRQVSTDDRFNRDDRIAITKTFPTGGAFETREEANIKMKALVAMFLSKLNAAEVARVGGAADILNERKMIDDLAGLVRAGHLHEDAATDLLVQIFGE